MFRKSIIIAIVTIIISLFAANSFAQLKGSTSGYLPGSTGTRPTPGTMGGLLGTGNTGTIKTGGRINPGGGTASATGVADLVYQSNGVFYGTAYAYNGSHFELYTADGGVLKTYANSCKPAAPSGGVAGLVCSFGHFNRNGQLFYSGWTYIYANGFVYLRWMYQARSNFQYVDGDTGWIGFMPKP